MSKAMDKLRKEMEKIGEIEAAIEAVYTAHCDECAVDHNANTDSWDIAEKVYELGWRCNAKGVLYCPDCAKKFKIK
jgi:hypothetical protein